MQALYRVSLDRGLITAMKPTEEAWTTSFSFETARSRPRGTPAYTCGDVIVLGLLSLDLHTLHGSCFPSREHGSRGPAYCLLVYREFVALLSSWPVRDAESL
jgi:hypothetical protein